MAELRHLKDRRWSPRGGRRPDDDGGFAPLIFLIDDDPTRREICALILLQSRFAVAPFATAARALALLPSFEPDAIVVAPAELDSVTAEAFPTRRGGKRIPVVPLPSRNDAIVSALRLAFQTSAWK